MATHCCCTLKKVNFVAGKRRTAKHDMLLMIMLLMLVVCCFMFALAGWLVAKPGWNSVRKNEVNKFSAYFPVACFVGGGVLFFFLFFFILITPLSCRACFFPSHTHTRAHVCSTQNLCARALCCHRPTDRPTVRPALVMRVFFRVIPKCIRPALGICLMMPFACIGWVVASCPFPSHAAYHATNPPGLIRRAYVL